MSSVRKLKLCSWSSGENAAASLLPLSHSAHEIIRAHHDVSSDSDDLYQPIREARMEFLQRKLDDGRFYMPEIYFFLRSEGQTVKKAGLFQRKKDFTDSLLSDFEAAKARFAISVSQTDAALRSAGFHLRRLRAMNGAIFAFLISILKDRGKLGYLQCGLGTIRFRRRSVISGPRKKISSVFLN